MKILFIGDVFGSPGRKIISENLSLLRSEHGIDLVIANAENSAHGKGLTPRIFNGLVSAGVDFFTMGNHTWSRSEILEVFAANKNIVRPLNLKSTFPHSSAGEGSRVIVVKGLKIRITNLIGNSVNFKQMQTNAFTTMRELLSSTEKPDIHFVDLHAETTSEKYAFLWAFNGKVDVIVGTHTHVPTNDICITNEHTAFVCDVGMTGPAHGVIGGRKEPIISRFFDPSLKFSLEVEEGPRQLCSVIIEFDEQLKRVVSIKPLIIREGFAFTALENLVIHE